MARGRKRVRITNGALETERKKIKETPKRGRWPKFSNILDVEDYIFMFKNPAKTFAHPRHGNICFGKVLYRGEGTVCDFTFRVDLPNEYNVIAAVRFLCASYNSEEGWIIDTCCRNTGIYEHPKIGCQRTSCPYHKKGFIETTLKDRAFEEDINIVLNRIHNEKIDSKNV